MSHSEQEKIDASPGLVVRTSEPEAVTGKITVGEMMYGRRVMVHVPHESGLVELRLRVSVARDLAVDLQETIRQIERNYPESEIL